MTNSCPPDCSGCQCPNGHPPCYHCLDGHDLSIQERIDNMHIDWPLFNPGDYISIDGVDLVVMIRDDYVIEQGVDSVAAWRQGEDKIVVHAEGVSGLALANIRNRHGWYKPQLEVTVSDKRPTIFGATADMIIMDDIVEALPITYNLDKNRSLDKTLKPGDIAQFKSTIWRIVDGLWLAKHRQHLTDVRFCCSENNTFLVRPDDYDCAMLTATVNTIAKVTPHDPDGPPIARRASGVYNAPTKRPVQSYVQPHHSTALAGAVSQLGRTPNLHSELRSGVNFDSSD